MRNLLLLVSLIWGCADDGCPTDDCTLKPRTIVKWTLDSYPERGFASGDSCVDFGARKVAVNMVDGAGKITSAIDDCGVAQVVVEGLAPGDYTAYIMPQDGAGNPLLTTQISAPVTATSNGAEVTVNVPWDAWVGDHTGTFLFRISWNGLSCEAASPMIEKQVLTLTVNGVVQNIMTDDGQMMNGSDMKPCKRLSDQFPQSALGAQFGVATLLVEGYDEMDSLRLSKQFDTFVGAGITNPTLTFNVPLM